MNTFFLMCGAFAAGAIVNTATVKAGAKLVWNWAWSKAV